MKKEKVTKIHRIEDFIFYLSFRSSVLSSGIQWVSWWTAKHQKSIPPLKTPVSPDISILLAGFYRLWSDMSGPQARHAWPLSLLQLSSLVLVTLAEHIRPPT
jgi:hypothetical protein